MFIRIAPMEDWSGNGIELSNNGIIAFTSLFSAGKFQRIAKLIQAIGYGLQNMS